MRLAIIPARGGSKRIPKKNIRFFMGKPIIAYSIELAIQSGLFDKVIVSTDSEEIAQVGANYGAGVPFLRPLELSDDHAATLCVIAHAIQWFLNHGEAFHEICCIYPTAPLLNVAYLEKGLLALQHREVNYAFSACKFSYPVFRAFKITSTGRAEMFFPGFYNKRSQDLEQTYHDAGQFYWGKPDAFLQELPIFSPYSVPIILPCHLVQDIDTEEDWQRLELLYRQLQF